jgi:hypothetical protein
VDLTEIVQSLAGRSLFPSSSLSCGPEQALAFVHGFSPIFNLDCVIKMREAVPYRERRGNDTAITLPALPALSARQWKRFRVRPQSVLAGSGSSCQHRQMHYTSCRHAQLRSDTNGRVPFPVGHRRATGAPSAKFRPQYPNNSGLQPGNNEIVLRIRKLKVIAATVVFLHRYSISLPGTGTGPGTETGSRPRGRILHMPGHTKEKERRIP